MPDRAIGTIPFEQYFAEQLAAGTLPYDDAIRDYTRRLPHEERDDAAPRRGSGF
jgi:hypothetical protein